MEEKPLMPKKSGGKKNEKPQVYVLRDVKEYLGESVLIIFSVLLAPFLTEYINGLHEKRDTKELLTNIKNELVSNRLSEKQQYSYQQKVLRNIDSALKNVEFQRKIVADDQFHLSLLAPDGIIYRDLNNVAWDVAKSHDITSKASFKIIAKLTDIYDNQARIDKLEDKVAEVLLNRDSRDPTQAHETLILLRDNYKGWAFDRAPSLIAKYDEAIKMLEEEK